LRNLESFQRASKARANIAKMQEQSLLLRPADQMALLIK
jgi:hypothetical protein